MILLIILVIASTPLLKVIYHKLIQSKYSLIIELIIIVTNTDISKEIKINLIIF